MQKDLENFLLQMKFTKNEIEDMKNIAPTLDVTTLKEVKGVMRVLSCYGFPKEDLPDLYCQNPNVMTMDENVLMNELDKLILQKIDIEEYLKNNPFAIWN